jgi:uncharacterized protein
MRQNWRDLLFLHWPFPPEVVRPLVPPQLDLDLFDGDAYIGLVPFTMTGVRPVGCPPMPGLSSFHEINVRTYVHYRGRNPGVWFFSLDAANAIAVKLARRLFRLPYYYARMFLEHKQATHRGEPTSILYAGVRHGRAQLPASYAIRATPTGVAQTASLATLEYFLVERYILYAGDRADLYLGYVHHRPYPLQAAKLDALDETLLAANRLERPESAPLAHFASGVSVEVFALKSVWSSSA